MTAVLKALLVAGTTAWVSTIAFAQSPASPDWTAVQRETLEHFQALVRFDTQDPPGGEQKAADYLQQVLSREGIPVEVFTLDKGRPNIVARLKGSGRKRPLLIMGHTDTVNVDPAKWTHPPFGAVVADGYVYGRGTLDDKDNVVASLMTMLVLKRLNVTLDRDVIFLAEAGEEGTHARRHPVHGQRALPGDRSRVLPRGDRQRHARGRPGALRDGADGREAAAGDRTDGPRPGRPWLGAADDQRDRACVDGRRHGREHGARR